MPARTARKRIHFVRATYNQGAAPAISLETAVRRSLRGRSVTDSQVPMARLGLMETRQKFLPNRGAIRVALGAGAPGEAMSTMGLAIQGQDDTDLVNPPPRNRAFKIADAFCLIEGNELLVMVDGMRIGAVAEYLRQLLSLANQPPENSAFELTPVSDPSKEDVLAEEGVSALRLRGTAYAAEDVRTLEPGADATGMIERLWSDLTSGVRDVFTREAETPQEREEMAANWGQLMVTTVIRARGGSRDLPPIFRSRLI